jgi:hypothetical protein
MARPSSEAFQVGAHEALSPNEAVLVGGGQERPREPAPEPERVQRLGAGFHEIETGQFDELHPPGQGLGGVPDDLGRGAAENEETSLLAWAVGEQAQNRK